MSGPRPIDVIDIASTDGNGGESVLGSSLDDSVELVTVSEGEEEVLASLPQSSVQVLTAGTATALAALASAAPALAALAHSECAGPWRGWRPNGACGGPHRAVSHSGLQLCAGPGEGAGGGLYEEGGVGAAGGPYRDHFRPTGQCDGSGHHPLQVNLGGKPP